MNHWIHEKINELQKILEDYQYASYYLELKL